MAFLGARLRPGVDVVMEAVRLHERMEKADLVVTGEGMFDEQSLHGKAPAGVLRAAEELRIPAIVLCGQKRADPPAAGPDGDTDERIGGAFDAAELTFGRCASGFDRSRGRQRRTQAHALDHPALMPTLT